MKPSFEVPALRLREIAGLGFDVWFLDPVSGMSLTVGRIEPDHPGAEFGCQHLGKTPGATAKVYDLGNRGSVDMGQQ